MVVVNLADDLPQHVSTADKFVTFESDTADEMHALAALVLEPPVTVNECHACDN